MHYLRSTFHASFPFPSNARVAHLTQSAWHWVWVPMIQFFFFELSSSWHDEAIVRRFSIAGIPLAPLNSVAYN